MKNIISIICFILVFVSSTFGQTEPRLSQQAFLFSYSSIDSFYKFSDTFFEYNDFGKVSRTITKGYDRDGVIIGIRGTFYIYNSENLLTKETTRRYNSDVNIWITEYWYEYEYDSNGCEVSNKFIRNVGGLFYHLQYERNADCQITKETNSAKYTSTDSFELRYIYERTYYSDGISYKETRSEPQAFLDYEIVEKSIWDTYLLPNGELDEVYTTFNNNSGEYEYTAKYIYEYDQFDNLSASYTYKMDSMIPDWEMLYHYQYENEYNEENQLISIGTILMDYTFDPPRYVEGGTNNYEYWCDNLEKANEIDFGIEFWIYRTESYYEGINECFDIENELLEIDIFPNPTSGIVTINSPIFDSGDTQISVFDISGKLLLEKNEPRRGELMDFDLGNLPNGMYVIQLMNQEHFVQHKVVLTK